MVKLVIFIAAFTIALAAPVQKSLIPMNDLANIGNFDVETLDCANIDKIVKASKDEYEDVKKASNAETAAKITTVLTGALGSAFAETVDNNLKVDKKSKDVFADLFNIVGVLKDKVIAGDSLSCADVRKIVKTPLEKHKDYLASKQYKDDAALASKFFSSKEFQEEMNKKFDEKAEKEKQKTLGSL